MTEARQVLEIRHKFVIFGMAGFRCLNEDIYFVACRLHCA
jgi:hypothetical protein